MPPHLSTSHRIIRQPTSPRRSEGTTHRKHAAHDITNGDSDEEKTEQKDEGSAAAILQHRHTVRIHDTHYVATLTLPPSHTQFELALYCPHTGRTHANSFTVEYIAALTRKAQHPLPFAAFLALLSAALSSTAQSASTSYAATSSASAAVTLDVLSSSDIHIIRSRVGQSSSSTTSLDGSDSKLYLVLTLPLPPARHVHFPLPLPLPNAAASQLQQHQPQPQQEQYESSLPVSPAAPSALSALTATIAQLSRALKDARREARHERDTRRQREEVDKGERDSMRAEIQWLKERVGQHERDSSTGSGGSSGGVSVSASERRVDGVRGGSSVDWLRAKLQREERQRKETDVLLVMWRTRCEQAEAELARLSSARGGRMNSSGRGSSHSSKERVRGRPRERQAAQLPSHRTVSSRSVSPSYMRQTSSTAAKQQHSPHSLSTSQQHSPRSSVSLSSADLSRPASPRPRTTTPQRSPTPPPPATYQPTAIRASQLTNSSPTSSAHLSLQRASKLSRPTSARHSTRSLSPALTSRATPPQPHSHHHSHSHSRPQLSTGSQHNRANSENGGGEQAESSSRPELVSGSTAAFSSSVVLIGSSDVHSRLSALQSFLREEKSKAVRRKQ